MRHLPPVAWSTVLPGAVVQWGGAPRTVHANDPLGPMQRIVLAEGLPPFVVPGAIGVRPVELDDADAIGNMLRAGLTLEII